MQPTMWPVLHVGSAFNSAFINNPAGVPTAASIQLTCGKGFSGQSTLWTEEYR